METQAARRKRWPRALLWTMTAAFAAFVAYTWLSPTGVGLMLTKLGAVRFATPEAQPFHGQRVDEEPRWEPGEDLTALQPLYAADQELAADTPVTFTFLYDLPPAGNGVRCGDGFAVLIEGLERVILYDAGLNADVLARNARALGKSLEDVDVLVISHTSEDHFEGIEAFAEVRRRPIGYYPLGVRGERLDVIRRYTSAARPVGGPARLMRGVFTTGPAPRHPELALMLATAQGAVHLLSCGHIGRAPFLDHALRLAGQRLYLDIGGFCPLWDAPYEEQIEAWIRVRERDPRHIAFCHCAPDALRWLAAGEWSGRNVHIGGGSVITVPAGPPQPPLVRP